MSFSAISGARGCYQKYAASVSKITAPTKARPIRVKMGSMFLYPYQSVSEGIV